MTNGVAGFLLANGALNADGIEREIRQKLIENDKVEAIIVLPRNMFYTTDISVTLWILNNNKSDHELHGHLIRNHQNEVLFMDLRQWNDHVQQYKVEKGTNKKKTILTDEQIAKVKLIYQSWQKGSDYEDTPELCKSVTIDKIKEANYSLAPSKYIEFIDHDLDINYEKEMSRIQSEMKEVLISENNRKIVLRKLSGG